MPYSTYAKEQMFAWSFLSGSAVRPASFFIGIVDATGGPDATAVEIQLVDGYSRQPLSFNFISSTEYTNTNTASWGSLGATNIGGFALYDSSSFSSLNAWIWWDVTPLVLPAGSAVTVSATSLIVDLTL